MARIFFFTSLSGFHLHARTTRNLASKQTPTIMEFPRAFNEEPLQPFERSAVRASEARILAAEKIRPRPQTVRNHGHPIARSTPRDKPIVNPVIHRRPPARIVKSGVQMQRT